MKKIFLFLPLLFSALSPNCFSMSLSSLSCEGDYKLEVKGRPTGARHTDVSRAGVFLIKDYGQDIQNKPGSRYAVIVIHDQKARSWGFFAGKVERNDQYTTNTASRELSEESGKTLSIRPSTLKRPALYISCREAAIRC